MMLNAVKMALKDDAVLSYYHYGTLELIWGHLILYVDRSAAAKCAGFFYNFPFLYKFSSRESL